MEGNNSINSGLPITYAATETAICAAAVGILALKFGTRGPPCNPVGLPLYFLGGCILVPSIMVPVYYFAEPSIRPQERRIKDFGASSLWDKAVKVVLKVSLYTAVGMAAGWAIKLSEPKPEWPNIPAAFAAQLSGMYLSVVWLTSLHLEKRAWQAKASTPQDT